VAVEEVLLLDLEDKVRGFDRTLPINPNQMQDL